MSVSPVKQRRTDNPLAQEADGTQRTPGSDFIPLPSSSGEGDNVTQLSSVGDNLSVYLDHATPTKQFEIRRAINKHHMTRNRIAEFFQGSYMPDREVIERGLDGTLSEAECSLFNKWLANRRQAHEHTARVLGTKPSESILEWLKNTRYETTPSVAGRDRSPSNPPQMSADPPATAGSRDIRFCMFNVGQISRRDFWKILKERLAEDIVQGISRIENVLQPANGRRRIDFWVDPMVASALKAALYLTSRSRREDPKKYHALPTSEMPVIWKPNARIKHWRLDFYRSWRDRHPGPVIAKIGDKEPTRRGIATFNVNGLNNKLLEVEIFAERNGVAILALQETMMNHNKYPICIGNFEVYQHGKSSSKKEGSFRGQAILVHRSYPSYQSSTTTNKSLIHVQVTKLVKGKIWHFLSVYLPSGGNMRKERRRCLNIVLRETEVILEKDPSALITVLGDFNITREELLKRLLRKRARLESNPIRGCGLTFHRKSTQWSDIDHILTSASVKALVERTTVVRRWNHRSDKDSDHWPMLMRIRKNVQEKAEPKKLPHYRFDTNAIRSLGEALVHHNRWSVLPVDPISSDEELNDATEEFCGIVNQIGLDLGIRRPACEKLFTHTRKIARLGKKVSDARKRWQAAKYEAAQDAKILKTKYVDMKKEFHTSVRERKSKIYAKRIENAITMFRENDMRSFHRWEKKSSHVKQRTNHSTPVKDKGGNIHTDQESVLRLNTEYYSDLFNDDPEGLSQNESYWKGKAGPRKPQLDCNQAIVWRAVLIAIREMILGTAAGDDKLPVEVYKCLLKEECHAKARKENGGQPIGDQIYLALPENQLPAEPQTPMGKYLMRIVTGIWDRRAQPAFWDTAANISLYKSGDPTDLHNYRGISLIAVGMKVVTAVLARRITTLCEENGLLAKGQGGFRPGEEAVAQFIALAETVRRRACHNGSKTYIVFIDFMKAFDKVMHEALFEKMDALGFRGALLDLIRAIYRTSKAAVRLDGKSGMAYNLIRGTRQGCPLSPILFLIFINDLLEMLPEGVEIPGITGQRCSALMFADDVAGICPTIAATHQLLDGVARWSAKWHMPLGPKKCNVMMCGGTEEEQEAFKTDNVFMAGEDIIETTRLYKYLGIMVTDKLGDTLNGDQKAHARTLAAKIRTAISVRRAFLKDPMIPAELKMAVITSKIFSVGTYGGEWIGMKQEYAAILQKEAGIALRLVLQSASKSTLHASPPMSIELGVPLMEETLNMLQLRLWLKAPSMKGWISTLVDQPFKNKTKVWSTLTKWNLKVMLQAWGALKQREDLVTAAKDILRDRGKWSDLAKEVTDETLFEELEPNFLKEWVRLVSLTRVLVNDHNKGIVGTQFYIQLGFYRTRKFLKAAIYTPELTEGVNWLSRMRTNSWWTTKRALFTLHGCDAQGEKLKADQCASCKQMLQKDEPEFVHLLISCRCWDRERIIHIGRHIWTLHKALSTRRGGVLHPKHWRFEAAVRLLGGRPMPSNKILEVGDLKWEANPEGNPDVSPVLDYIEKGWGHLGETHTPGLKAHGYTVVARFLGIVMPKHRANLFSYRRNPTGSETGTVRLMNESTVGFISPIKRIRHQPVPRNQRETLTPTPLNPVPRQPSVVPQADEHLMAAKSWIQDRRKHALYISPENSDEESGFASDMYM